MEGVRGYTEMHSRVGVTAIKTAIVTILADRCWWSKGLRTLHRPVIEKLWLATQFLRWESAIGVCFLIGILLLHVLQIGVEHAACCETKNIGYLVRYHIGLCLVLLTMVKTNGVHKLLFIFLLVIVIIIITALLLIGAHMLWQLFGDLLLQLQWWRLVAC